jgi:hypothetical protein
MSNQTFRRERIEGRRRNSGFAAEPDGLDINTTTRETARNIRKDGGSVKTVKETVNGQFGSIDLTTLKGNSNVHRKYTSSPSS